MPYQPHQRSPAIENRMGTLGGPVRFSIAGERAPPPPYHHLYRTSFISSIDPNVFILLQCHPITRPFGPKSDVKQ